jgi:hypothetical protein
MNSPVPSAAVRPTVSSWSPQIKSVGTVVGPTGAWRTPRARYHASAASIACGLSITDRWASIAAGGTPFFVRRVRSQFASSARMFGPASGSRNVRWCPDRRRCSPSGSSSARANAS